MPRLTATALLIFGALAAPAGGASFDAPRTLQDDADAQQVVAAPGAVAWQGGSGVWLATGTGDAARRGDRRRSERAGRGLAARPRRSPTARSGSWPPTAT
jgi:hypothetical protein